MAIFRLVVVFWLGYSCQLYAAASGEELQTKIQALQKVFCGQEKQESLNQKIHALVEKRIADLPLSARTQLPPLAEVDALIKEQIWTTFHVDALCLERGSLESAKTTGIINGYATSGFLENFGPYSLIHEAGHMAMANMVYSNTSTTFHVVKFDVFVCFAREVFSGHGSLAGFVDVLNPAGGVVDSTGTLVQSWSTYTTNHGLTAFGATMGNNGAQVFVLLGGMIFTTIAQVMGIVIGMHLKDRHPFLGYTLIVASAAAYLTELQGWIAASVAASSGGAASADIVKVAALLGISPLAISGTIFGITAAVIITYVGVSKYLKHLKEIRIAAKSLLNEGILAAIKGSNGSLLDDLWDSYPRRKEFDAALQNMAQLVETSSQKNLEQQVRALEKLWIPAEAQGSAPPKKSLRDYLPNSDTLRRFWQRYLDSRVVKTYQSELKRFHKHVASDRSAIDLTRQEWVGKSAIAKILQGKFLTEKRGWFQAEPIEHDQRSKLVDNYLVDQEILPLHQLVTANVKRIKFNDQAAALGTKHRWKTVISREAFSALKDKRGLWFGLKHLTYHYFIMDLQFYVQDGLYRFTRKMNQNNPEKMEKSVKNFLKNVLFVPKEYRDIPEALRAITTYSQAVAAQDRDKLKKWWMLDVVDEASCKIEVDFVCTMAGFILRDTLPEGQEYHCPLAVPYSCPELVRSKGLLRAVIPQGA